MKRRRFITLIATSAVTSPFAVRAQQGSMPVIGFLNAASPGPFANLVAGFRKGLGETGFVEGRNIAIEFRWAEGRYERLPAMARALVQRPVAVLVTGGGTTAALAAKEASSIIPIVSSMGGDPVALGLVRSFNRPGGNVTGVALLATQLDAKRLEMIRAMIPTANVIGGIFNPDSRTAQTQLKDVVDAARQLGVRFVPFHARNEAALETVFSTMAQQRMDALLVASDPYFNSQRDRLVTLAARYKLPAIYEWREFAALGGLMSFGADLADMYRQIGVYTGRILKGAKPADLPVVQPTRFAMVVNAKTAKSLGIRIPNEVLQRADELIE